MDNASCPEKWRRKPLRVYHEKQSVLLQHCAVHTLNNVLQAPTYTAKHFEDLAIALQHRQFPVANSKQENLAIPLPSHATDQAQHYSGACIQARGREKYVNEVTEQTTVRLQAQGTTRRKAGEEAERYPNKDLLDMQRKNLFRMCPCPCSATANKARLRISADVHRKSCTLTQRSERDGDIPAPLIASHPIGPFYHSGTSQIPTFQVQSSSSETDLSSYIKQLSFLHTSDSDNCSCFSPAKSAKEVRTGTAYGSHSRSGSPTTARPPIVSAAADVDYFRISGCNSSVGPSVSIQRTRITPATLCQLNASAPAVSGCHLGRCSEECGGGLSEEGHPRATEGNSKFSAADKHGTPFPKTRNCVPSERRNCFTCEETEDFLGCGQNVRGAYYGNCFAIRAKISRDCSFAASPRHRYQVMNDLFRASSAIPAIRARGSDCLSRTCNAPASAANLTQPLKSLSGFPATTCPPQRNTKTSLQFSATPLSKGEAEVSWRKRVFSVLLGTDYSAPLGLGNYDLSLLQQLLCLHRLSLNFANNPSQLQAAVHKLQKREVYSFLEEGEKRGARGGNAAGERAPLRLCQAPISSHEEQRPTYGKQEERHTRHQSQKGTAVPIKPRPSPQLKPREYSNGWVTTEQLRNPRLLAFILNVKIPRTGWRRLIPIVGADRHFYTIRKIRCAATTSAEIASKEGPKHAGLAALLEKNSGLTPVCTTVDGGNRAYSSFFPRAEEGKSNAELSELYKCSYRLTPVNLSLAAHPTCDTEVANPGSISDESCSRVLALEGSRQQKTFCRTMDEYGVDFIWLDLDSRLSKPRFFENEEALVLHLNRKLEDAFLGRTGWGIEQLRQMTGSVPLENYATGGRSNLCVFDSGGEKCRKSDSYVPKLGYAVAARTDRTNAATSRCLSSNCSADGQLCINGVTWKPVRSSCVRERDVSDAAEAWLSTHSHCEGRAQEPARFSSTVDPRSATAGPQGRDQSPALSSVLPASIQEDMTGYSLGTSVQKKEGGIAVTKRMTAEDQSEAEAADTVCGAADTGRGDKTLDSISASELSDVIPYGSEEVEDRRGYTDLILIEVLEEVETGGV